jgi:hypothetical protein
MKFLLVLLITAFPVSAVELEDATQKQILGAVLGADSTKVEATLTAVKSSNPDELKTDKEAMDFLVFTLKDMVRSWEVYRVKPMVVPAQLDSTVDATLWRDVKVVKLEREQAVADSIAAAMPRP